MILYARGYTDSIVADVNDVFTCVGNVETRTEYFSKNELCNASVVEKREKKWTT